MVEGLLIDKTLLYGEDMALTETGDFQVVSGYAVVLQAAQNRVLSSLGTRRYDSSYGSEIQSGLSQLPSGKVNNNLMANYVAFALQPMVLDGRIQTINSVTILDKTADSIFIQIVLTLGTYTGSIVIEMPNFIS